MPKIRDILNQIIVEEAQRERICRRHTSGKSAHKIVKGHVCLVIPTNPTDDPYSYCTEAAKPILDAAWIKLHSLYNALGLTPPA
jgi:hypothetical protein